MKKYQRVLSEMHLYKNKAEALIRTLIWIASWIGGIWTLLGAEDKKVLGSAYLIYTLSLLTEFVPKIKEKTQFLSKLLHTILCSIISITLVMAICILFGGKVEDGFYTVMLVLTIIIIGYLVTDTFILWLDLENGLEGTGDESINVRIDDQELRFSERLLEGNLGCIDEGAGSDE